MLMLVALPLAAAQSTREPEAEVYSGAPAYSGLPSEVGLFVRVTGLENQQIILNLTSDYPLSWRETTLALDHEATARTKVVVTLPPGRTHIVAHLRSVNGSWSDRLLVSVDALDALDVQISVNGQPFGNRAWAMVGDPLAVTARVTNVGPHPSLAHDLKLGVEPAAPWVTVPPLEPGTTFEAELWTQNASEDFEGEYLALRWGQKGGWRAEALSLYEKGIVEVSPAVVRVQRVMGPTVGVALAASDEISDAWQVNMTLINPGENEILATAIIRLLPEAPGAALRSRGAEWLWSTKVPARGYVERVEFATTSVEGPHIVTASLLEPGRSYAHASAGDASPIAGYLTLPVRPRAGEEVTVQVRALAPPASGEAPLLSVFPETHDPPIGRLGHFVTERDFLSILSITPGTDGRSWTYTVVFPVAQALDVSAYWNLNGTLMPLAAVEPGPANVEVVPVAHDGVLTHAAWIGPVVVAASMFLSVRMRVRPSRP